MEKRDISGLQQNRSIYLKIGLICSLSFTIWALALEGYYPNNIVYKTTNFDAFEEIPILRTIQKPKLKVPPPTIELSKEIPKLEDFDFTSEIMPLETKVAIKPQNLEVISNKITPTPLPIPPTPPTPEEKVPDIFKIVEEMPRFGECADQLWSKEEKKKCSDHKILSYFTKNIRYPKIARNNGISGTVVIRFVIDREGRVINPEIVKDIGGGCGKEALRVVKEMPDWTPGMQRGRKVQVQMHLPVRFRVE